jgi:hypothetical protein
MKNLKCHPLLKMVNSYAIGSPQPSKNNTHSNLRYFSSTSSKKVNNIALGVILSVISQSTFGILRHIAMLFTLVIFLNSTQLVIPDNALDALKLVDL